MQGVGTTKFIGRLKTSETGAAIMRATGAAVLRWAPPGKMMTMDYQPQPGNRSPRTPTGKITAINCG